MYLKYIKESDLKIICKRGKEEIWIDTETKKTDDYIPNKIQIIEPWLEGDRQDDVSILCEDVEEGE